MASALGESNTMNKPSSSTINIQDPFFYQLRKEARTVHVYLVSGKRLTGILRRFDRYAIIIENSGQEQLVYKHAVASISPAGGGYPGSDESTV
jgi:host factor-I protein